MPRVHELIKISIVNFFTGKNNVLFHYFAHRELVRGIPVTDEEGNRIGDSKVV